MNRETFVSKARSIFSDNAGRRMIGAQVSGPKIDGGRLGTLGAGNLRVFKRRADAKFKAWAVEILVDCSGSIWRDGRAAPLVQTVRELVPALKASEVGTVRVTGVNQVEIAIEKELADEGEFMAMLQYFREMYGGWARVGEFKARDGGGTHDGHHIRSAARRLIASGMPGKILLVTTDGLPHCDRAGGRCKNKGCAPVGHGDVWLEADMMEAIAEARRAGVIVLGVGIQAAHVAKFYGPAHSESVNNLGELFQKTAALVERHIIRG